MIKKPRHTDLKFLVEFIKTYNKYDKFPLKPNGIYVVIFLLIRYRNTRTDNDYQHIIEFLKYCKSLYGDEFDINSAGIDNQRGYGAQRKIIERLMNGKPVKDWLKIVEYILNEFGDKYDRSNPDLIQYCLENTEYECFEYLVNKYKDEYTLEFICNSLKHIMNNIKNSNKKWDPRYAELRNIV